jgi:hypothetical protein
MLEGSWGLLATALIAVPLLVVAVRPSGASDVAKHQTVLVGCFLVAATMCVAPEFLILPLGLGLSTLAWWWPLSTSAQSPRTPGRLARWWPFLLIAAGFLALPPLLLGAEVFTPKTVAMLLGVAALVAWLAYALRDTPTRARSVSWPLLITAAITAGPWLGYALRMAAESRDGFEYIGSGIDRVVAQTALPLMMVALPVAAALHWLPPRLAVWPAAVVGAGFGSFTIRYPDLVASPGATWGAAAVIGSASLVLVAEAPRLHTRK